MPDYARIYAKQEYLTPGAADTVAWLAETARPDASSRLLEVACGKGEAACTLAAQTDCRVLATDLFVPFLEHTARKVRERSLDALVATVRADGRQLPVPDETFDAAYCIGAPSIVGLEPGLRELRRAVRPGGVVAVSDVIWRQKPSGPLGPEWGWVAHQQPQVDADEFAAVIAACGFTVEQVHIHPRSAWDDYHRPMTAVATDARAEGDTAFADEMEADLALEQRALDAFWEYATFIARRS